MKKVVVLLSLVVFLVVSCAKKEQAGCTCTNDIVSCTCDNNIVSCTCNNEIVGCTCNNDTVSCTCDNNIDGCTCTNDIVSCTCNNEICCCASTENGVNINGVIWATRNVDAPGTFAENPEDAGMFYQWNRKEGVTFWDNSIPDVTKWEDVNCPCPDGWRLPTAQELHDIRVNSSWTTQNGVNGRLFGIAPNQIFMPAAGWLDGLESSPHNAGAIGYYWSSMRYGYYFGVQDEDGAHAFTFGSENAGFYFPQWVTI